MSGTCSDRTGVEVAQIAYVQAGGVSALIILEPSALRRGAGAPDPAAEIPVSISDSVATDGTLSHIVLRDGDELPEHRVFSTNGMTPAAAMGVNVNASEAAPDFDVTMVSPAFATFVALGSPGAGVIHGSGGGGLVPPHLRPLTINGRDGADVLKDGGSMGRDTLTSIEYLGGGEAADLLRGTAGKETLDGGPGDDVLEGRGDDDHLFGDLGNDTASYASAAGPVTVDLALTAARATGAAGKGTLDQVENVAGGPDAEVLRGSEGPNTIKGGRAGTPCWPRAGTTPCSRATGDRTP